MPARIAEAIGAHLTGLVDSGIRRGSHIAGAIALGAAAVLVGCAPLHGLAAGGVDGVRHMLEVPRDGLVRTMAPTGCTRIPDRAERGPENA